MAVRIVFCALSFVGLAQASSVTPVQKVTSLLERLSKVITEEGHAEAVAYDKYACFCKAQADEKQTAIESSTAKIAALSLEITTLGNEITALINEISQLNTDISNLQTEITNLETTRQSEHTAFLAAHKTGAESIDTVERAIEALESSKKSTTGRVELNKAAMAQVNSALALAGEAPTLPPGGGDPYTYQYHSNDIIATLQNVLKTFKANQEQRESDEFDKKTAYDKAVLAKRNQKKFTEQERDEKQVEQAQKEEEKINKETDRTEETADKTEDGQFLTVLRDECRRTAQRWDQRSQTRMNELSVIGQAVDMLKSSVEPNWQANKKLSGLQKQAVSFLQLRGRNSESQRQAVAAAQRELQDAAKNLGSKTLSIAALQVLGSQDHFVKVRQIIKDLMAKLQQDAVDEQTEKSFCDTQIQTQVVRRDADQSTVETARGNIAAREASRATLQSEIAQLHDEIAKNKKDLDQATTLRLEEKAEHDKIIADATDGEGAVGQAIALLQGFYSTNHHVTIVLNQQQYTPWKATNSDRYGQTVSDLAPEVFKTQYGGSKDASTGIIAILEVIRSDFQRTITQVNADETASSSTYNTLKSNLETSTSTKQGMIGTKETAVTALDSDLVMLGNQLSAANESHADAVDQLALLEERCILTQESYKQRVENRNKEVEALKKAHAILEEWTS